MMPAALPRPHLEPAPAICIVVPTFRRPATLAALLAALASQTAGRSGIEILVVDNDPAGSAHDLVVAYASRSPLRTHYACIAEPGLSVVRNVGLAFARHRFDCVAMIDDDEIPAPDWLEQLLRVHDSSGAAAVIGPVPSRLPGDAPAWIRGGAFFDLPMFADGADVADGYTGNCLIDLRASAARDLCFDPRMNLAGGEDQLFFRELLARGGRIAFAAQAVATEIVAPARLTAGYLLRRSFRRGNTMWMCDRHIHGRSVGMLARRVAFGAGRISVGLALLPPRAVRYGTAGIVRSLCDVARGSGTLAGALGITYLAYRRRAGRGSESS
ncbi:MAG TPA: glycosyltransferase [Candidatus Elarobacter sp.]|jgi:glycosyltransferase involved in cell wall biosynthesis